MSDNEAQDLKQSSEKKAKLMAEIKARSRTAALNELSDSERSSLRDVIFQRVATSGVITADDIVASAEGLGCPETIKAATAFVERAASDKRGLTFEDFTVWWVTPVLGTSARKLPLQLSHCRPTLLFLMKSISFNFYRSTSQKHKEKTSMKH